MHCPREIVDGNIQVIENFQEEEQNESLVVKEKKKEVQAVIKKDWDLKIKVRKVKMVDFKGEKITKIEEKLDKVKNLKIEERDREENKPYEKEIEN